MKNKAFQKGPPAKQSPQTLQKELSILESAFDAITEGVIAIDKDDNVLTVNKLFREMWGLSEDAADLDTHDIFARISEFLSDPAAFAHEITEFSNNPHERTLSTWELKDGRIFELHCQAQKLEGKTIGRLFSCRDITIRMRALSELNKQERFLRAILENLSASVVACDADGNLTLFNRTKSDDVKNPAESIPPEEWAERFELYKPDGQTLMQLHEVPLYRALHEGFITDVEMVTRADDGRQLTLVTNGQALIDENNQKIGAVVVMHDVTERKKTESALRENESKLRNLLQSMSEGLLEVDTNEVIVFANDRFCEISGYEREELLGKVTLDLFFGPEDREVIERANSERKNGIAGNYELDLKRKCGDMLHVFIGGTPMMDANGEYCGTMGVFLDMTERKRAEDQLLHDAFHDGLTGLANRTLFMEHLQITIKRNRRGKQNLFAVLFFDFDHFKVINDSLGHAAGDKLIKLIAERLESGLRSGDLVARLGGDEFTILLNGLPSEQAAFLLAERIQEDLKRSFNIDGREIFTSASIGIAFATAGSSAEEMLRDADIAMYRAKAKGKARFQVFDKEMHETAIKRLHLETELRQALKNREFYVFYQPIIDLDTYELTGFEALIRWKHPERGIVSPGEFIPAAEENNMILAIGKWTLYESCRQLRQWQNEIPEAEGLRVSVNLSVKEFLQFDLAEQIAETLEKTGLDAACLKLEITESHVMEDSDMAVAMMNRLRELGVQMSLDDFGTGYSSLSYLHRLPVSYLKIDRSFVTRMTDRNENREIVNTIIRLAHNLKMKVIAEGIETTEQLAELKNFGCEYGQGYFFSRPLDAKNAEWFIKGPQMNSMLASSKQIVRVADSIYLNS